MKILFLFSILVLIILTGCSGSALSSQPETPTLVPTLVSTNTRAPSLTPTSLPTGTPTPTQTLTPTITRTPTITLTPPITPTPTFDYPDASILMQANCRYGPGRAYLYSHGLYEGDRAEVHGRNYSGSWLWLQPENLDRHCWAAASVLDIQGDVKTVNYVQTRLPKASLYGPPDEVGAKRKGDQVKVFWSPVWMTEDDFRGYLIEATVCQAGQLLSVAVQTDGTSYEFTDEGGCSGESKGLLYVVEKHGYVDPVEIPWP